MPDLNQTTLSLLLLLLSWSVLAMTDIRCQCCRTVVFFALHCGCNALLMPCQSVANELLRQPDEHF
jgi:hypothetical protein